MWLSTHFFQKIADLLFPERCFGCGRTGTALCQNCIHEARIDGESTETQAPLRYEHIGAQKALWALKYRGIQTPLKPFGKLLHDHLLPLAGEIFELSPGRVAPILLIPIPLHKERQKKRGYNQSELLADELAKRSPRVFRVETSILIKTKSTKPQAQCATRRERQENLKNAFAVENTEKLMGETVILLDDVLTTGSTMKEAEKELLKKGAGAVHGVALFYAL